jgi:excisionase family DNA binding protein
MVDRDEINERVETPKQLAKRVGITERKVRYLLQRGDLDHVMIGSRIRIPDGAFRRFLASRMVKSCPDETRARLRWLAKRSCYYITWTERGRSRERSTWHGRPRTSSSRLRRMAAVPRRRTAQVSRRDPPNRRVERVPVQEKM